MKIDIGLGNGTPATQPDFELLRAGLTAMQATTPTAQASGQVHPAVDAAEALVRLFGTAAAADPPGTALRGSFNPGLAARREEG